MARPCILTREITDAVCEGLRLGLPIRQACAGVIHESSYYEWRARRDEGGLFAEFAEMTDEAIEGGFRRLAVKVLNGADLDPKLALEVLARRDHEHWGRRDRRTVEAKVVHSGNVLHGATDAQLSALLDKFGISGDE
jgi:hypothetical protein